MIYTLTYQLQIKLLSWAYSNPVMFFDLGPTSCSTDGLVTTPSLDNDPRVAIAHYAAVPTPIPSKGEGLVTVLAPTEVLDTIPSLDASPSVAILPEHPPSPGCALPCKILVLAPRPILCYTVDLDTIPNHGHPNPSSNPIRGKGPVHGYLYLFMGRTTPQLSLDLTQDPICRTLIQHPALSGSHTSPICLVTATGSYKAPVICFPGSPTTPPATSHSYRVRTNIVPGPWFWIQQHPCLSWIYSKHQYAWQPPSPKSSVPCSKCSEPQLPEINTPTSPGSPTTPPAASHNSRHLPSPKSSNPCSHATPSIQSRSYQKSGAWFKFYSILDSFAPTSDSDIFQICRKTSYLVTNP